MTISTLAKPLLGTATAMGLKPGMFCGTVGVRT